VAGHVKSDAGEGGVLLHTSDGGLHWEAQLGDPHSATRGFETVFFLDAKHGWASQWGGGALLRTRDGSTWESVYQFGNPHDVVFTTADVGFYVDGERLFRTEDGGHTWKQVFTCGTSVQVNGLTRATGCRFSTLSFPSANVGYAGTNALPNNAAALARTEDGGLSWNISRFIPDADVQERGLCFTDENTGFARIGGNKLAATSDGGQTWRGVPANVLNGWIRFADREVGWVARGFSVVYTSDGGKRWNSAQVRLPAEIYSSSLPARDRGYVVGKHGMIYRYRIVPVAYTSKWMIEAPMMASSHQ
jgi:photosystem II stability/assembly factor-like uncharacterized protein